jgi:hypothetical protein
VLGIPQRSGSTAGRNRSDRADTNEFGARTARIKADLRLTPEKRRIGLASRVP